LPYLAVFTGTTLPILGAVAATLYGILSFAEQEFVKSIEVIKDGEHNGKFFNNNRNYRIIF